MGEAVYADAIDEEGVGGEALTCGGGVDLVFRLEDAGVGLAGPLCVGESDAAARAAAGCIGDDAWGEAKKLVGIATESGQPGDIGGGDAGADAGVGGIEDGYFIDRDGDGLVGFTDGKLEVDVARRLGNQSHVVQRRELKAFGGGGERVGAGWELTKLIGSLLSGDV